MNNGSIIGIDMFAGDGYVLLDAHRVRPEDSRHDNAAALPAGLEGLKPETAQELRGGRRRSGPASVQGGDEAA